MQTQVAPSGEHKYNLRLTFRLPVGDRLFFPNFWHFVTFFIHVCKLNTVSSTNSSIFVEIICTKVTLCRKTLIVCGTVVTDELISIENAVITILGAEGCLLYTSDAADE